MVLAQEHGFRLPQIPCSKKKSFTRFYRNRTRPLTNVLFRYIDGIIVRPDYIKVENSVTDYSYLFIYFMTFPAFGLVKVGVCCMSQRNHLVTRMLSRIQRWTMDSY